MRTAQGQLGDTVLRADFRIDQKDNALATDNTNISDGPGNPFVQEDSHEHVLYVLRQSGTLDQLLSVLNARIALNESRSGKHILMKLQCLSCLLVFLWDSKVT